MKRAPLRALLLAWACGSRVASAQPAGDLLEPPLLPDSTNDARSAATLVIIVADEPGDAVSARLERDLRSLGLSVLLLKATPENSSSPAALERTARGLGGSVAMRVPANAQGSELLLFEPATNQTLTRSLARQEGSTADPNEVALGTLELLRASMMELHPPGRVRTEARPADVAPTRAAAQPPAAPAFSLSGAIAADLGLRSMGPSLSSLWAAWVRIGGCFGARGFASLPLMAARDDFPEGRVEVESLLLGAGLSCSFARRGAQLWPRVSLGVAGARVTTRGVAVDPARSSSGEAWLGGGYGMLGVGLRVTRELHVNFDATGVLLPTPAVIMAGGRQVGTWGAPSGMLSLGVEVLTGL